MTDGNKYAFSDVYTHHFSPEEYLKTYYTTPRGAEEMEGDLLPFLVDTNFILSQLLPDRMDKALDYGCGPTVHALMPSVDKFRTCYHADYLPRNRRVVEKWMRSEKDCWNFEPFAERFAILRHDRGITRSFEAKLRSKSAEVIHCDIFAENALPYHYHMAFDYIVTSLCLEGACTRLTDYKIGVLKLGKLVSPNGYVMQLAVLNEDKFTLGDVNFPVLPITFDQVKESWNEAGFTLVDSRYLPSILPGLGIGCCGVLVRKL